jgi:hypothetical protein
VLTLDGQVYQGIVADRDDSRIVLKEATGERRVIPTAEIEDQKAGGSLMPKGLTNIVTRGEFLDLVRFLSELGKPGPYALRATPSIQRWRVLSAVPAELARSAPDAEAFRVRVLGAEAGLWLPCYAKVAGGLPLDELTAAAGGPVLYLQGEVAVTTGGPVRFRFNSTAGMRAWVDAQPVPVHDTVTADLAGGRHTLTLRIDTAARPDRQVMVEVLKADGSPTELTVVGGR